MCCCSCNIKGGNGLLRIKECKGKCKKFPLLFCPDCNICRKCELQSRCSVCKIRTNVTNSTLCCHCEERICHRCTSMRMVCITMNLTRHICLMCMDKNNVRGHGKYTITRKSTLTRIKFSKKKAQKVFQNLWDTTITRMMESRGLVIKDISNMIKNYAWSINL